MKRMEINQSKAKIVESVKNEQNESKELKRKKSKKKQKKFLMHIAQPQHQ